MKRTLLPLILFVLALALGLAGCGEKSYSVTAVFDDAAGSVVLSEEGKTADGTYKEGTEVTVTVSPKAGRSVASFAVNGTPQTLTGDSPFVYKFSVARDTEIEVTFTEAAYTVTLEKDFGEEMGTASLSAPENGTEYVSGELVTLTVTVNAGYLTERVQVGDETVELENGEYSFAVRGDTAVKVTLRAIGYYRVTVKPFDESMGSVRVTPKAEDDGTYREGTQVTLAVSAKYGYKLLSVKVNGSEISLDANGEYSFAATEDVSVEVSFDERETYKLTFYFDTEMCSMSYYGMNEEGKFGDISLQPDVPTALYEGETLFHVTPAGGYDIYYVAVNDEQVTLSERSFTLNIGAALQDEKGEIKVGVACVFVFTELESLAGVYDLGDDVWYYFTLEDPAVFEFSANNYVAYAAFYPMTQVDSDSDEWEMGEEPVFRFNEDDRTNYAICTFEAGSYMARFSASTGDGAASSKLTVTELAYLSFEIKGFRASSFVSLDGKYKLYLGEHYFALKDEKGNAIQTGVSRSTDGEGTHTHVTFGGKSYLLGTQKAELTTGSDTSIDGLTVVLFNDTERVNFRPDPLPGNVTIDESLAGTYAGVTADDTPVEGDLVVRGNTLTWNDKTVTLLKDLVPVTEEDIDNIGDFISIGYCEEEFCILLAESTEEGNSIALMTEGQTIVFTPKAEGGLVIEEKFRGTWTCKVQTAVLFGYTLVIGEDSIVVKDASGQVVPTTVGTHTYRDAPYPSFTVNGVTYFLYSVVERAGSSSLTVYPAVGTMTAINFVAG